MNRPSYRDYFLAQPEENSELEKAVAAQSQYMKALENYASELETMMASTRTEFPEDHLKGHLDMINVPEEVNKKNFEKFMKAILAVATERNYQNHRVLSNSVPEAIQLQFGSSIAVINELLKEARSAWYTEAAPYHNACGYFRKIAAVAIQAMENYEAPLRQHG